MTHALYTYRYAPGIFDEQAANEMHGEIAGAAEVLVVEAVLHGRNVRQRLLLALAQER